MKNEKAYYGKFGGQFVPETLMPILEELDDAYQKYSKDGEFQRELDYYLREFAGRPTPLYYAKKLTAHLGGAKIYLKREDLTHTGAHKINNTIGQILLAKIMGKKRIIAETGAGQHGVATAATAAALGLECEVYMGEVDIRRQALNVFRMKLFGANVIPVNSGSKTLKDAINDALRDYIANCEDTHYVIGSVVGPHPYPLMVRNFQTVIGKEAKYQILEKEGKLPSHLIACVGGGSNALGLFSPFFDTDVKMIGVEAGGMGKENGAHGASLCYGSIGELHGELSYFIQDENGQISETHSVSAGLDYPGVGPEHAYYKDIGRAQYVAISDNETLNAFYLLSRLEGILPALESAHAVAQACKISPNLDSDESIIVCLSGRGDKDVNIVLELEEKK